jgi:hypothetical protein
MALLFKHFLFLRVVSYDEPSIFPVGLHYSKRKCKTIVIHVHIYIYIVQVMRVQQPFNSEQKNMCVVD